jgi:N utilization substance protein B
VAARSKARKRALDVLFESDVRGTDTLITLSDWVRRSDPPVQEYAVGLVEGVVTHRGRIDEVLSQYAEDWSLDRMPPVDRAVLRLALFELLWCEAIPDAVAIDEAVELAKSLSTEASPGFVNGLLSRVLRDGITGGSALAQVDRAVVGVEHAPGDEPLGEVARGVVVDDGE